MNLKGITHVKGYILCDSMYMAFLKRQNYIDGEQISGCQKLGEGIGCDHRGRAGGSFFGGDGTVIYPDCVYVS